jgi:protein-S-isoprenylcysteine O-methyltransferase Ste14
MRLWNLVFLAGFLVYTGIRHVYSQRTKSNEKMLSRNAPLDRTLLIFVIIGSLLLPLLYLVTPLLSFADYTLPQWAHWSGTAILPAALWLFWRAHADLGQNWSVALELRKNHELTTHGVYRWIRHPMYAAIWLFSLAQGLLLDNWLAGWFALAAFAPLYVLRTPREEAMMREHFGDAYRKYMAQTGRLLPRLWKK